MVLLFISKILLFEIELNRILALLKRIQHKSQEITIS